MNRLLTGALLLFITACCLTAAETRTVQIKSQWMNQTMPMLVITPDRAESDSQFRCPAIYLLHGHGNHYKTWSKETDLRTLSDQYSIIFVCPDAHSGWYFDSPVDSRIRIESYLTKECLPYVDSHFQTRPDPFYRAITGNSMGGHGALWLASRHPDLWRAAGSLSGGADLCPFPGNWNIALILGSYNQFPERWKASSAVNFLPLLKSPPALWIECGTEDFFLDANRRLHQNLLKAGIPHDYTERPGEHNWQYWANAIQYQTLFFAQFFNRQKK